MASGHDNLVNLNLIFKEEARLSLQENPFSMRIFQEEDAESSQSFLSYITISASSFFSYCHAYPPPTLVLFLPVLHSLLYSYLKPLSFFSSYKVIRYPPLKLVPLPVLFNPSGLESIQLKVHKERKRKEASISCNLFLQRKWIDRFTHSFQTRTRLW